MEIKNWFQSSINTNGGFDSECSAGMADPGRCRDRVCHISFPFCPSFLQGFTGCGLPGSSLLLQKYTDLDPSNSTASRNFSLYGFIIAMIATVIESLLTEHHCDE
jgi:hypothetical protein